MFNVGVVHLSVEAFEELAWATDLEKWLLVISNIIFFKTVMSLRN